MAAYRLARSTAGSGRGILQGSSRLSRRLEAPRVLQLVHPVQLRVLSTSRTVFAQVAAGPAVTPTNRAEITLKRFWKDVHVSQDADGNWIISLDHRKLKTPAGSKLLIPKDQRIMAAMIAHEWDVQDEVLKQHALPMTSLASRAVDGMSDQRVREGVVDQLLKYLKTDTILFPDDTPRTLVKNQKKYWDPIFQWAKDDLGITLHEAEGFAPAKQDEETIRVLRGIVEQFDIWQLAAFERAVYASKSFMIGLALVMGRITADQAAHAAHVEVQSQIELWGEVEDAHDVDYQDIRRALGSSACALIRL